MPDEKIILQNLPLEIKSGDGTAIEIYAGLAEKIKYKLPGFGHAHTTGGFGGMAFHHYAGDGFDIWYSHYSMRTNAEFVARANIPALELHIPFNRLFLSEWDGNAQALLHENAFEMSFYPFINSVSKFGAGEYSTFDIHYSAKYLEKFSMYYPVLARFLERVVKGEQANLLGITQLLSPAMIRLVNDMLGYDMSDAMAPYFYESGVLQMVIHVLERLSGLHTHEKKYTSYEIEQTIAAKDLICEDLGVKYRITELARKTGLNEGKLQQCFKQTFGTTIFDYSQTARLELAKQLLLEDSISIHSVAILCGYSDHPNLTSAFRNKFGYTPEFYRSNKK